MHFVFYFSQPFYTSRDGYKMCCRIYLNGDGLGKGKYVSLFFVLMKGNNNNNNTLYFKRVTI